MRPIRSQCKSILIEITLIMFVITIFFKRINEKKRITITLCCVVLCCVVLCCVVLCNVVLCYVMLCYVMLCYMLYLLLLFLSF